MAGFTWKYNLSGGRPLILKFLAKNTETLTKGDIGNLESGEIDLGATSDTGLVGAIQGVANESLSAEASSGVITAVDSTTVLEVIANPDAVYETTDANARNAGATLDLSGATGAQTVAATANTEFVVVERKLQTADPTRVMITAPSHYLAKVQ